MVIGDKIKGICDRFWLFTIAAIALAVISIVVGSIVIKGEMPKDSGELFTAVVTGLLLIVQKVIDAQQQRRLSDQLHASQPVERAPQSAVEGAHEAAEAAQAKAAEIERSA